MYFYQTLDDYVKVYHSNCLSGRGFGTLAEAKYACSNDNHCVGILDEGCKEDFEYYICLDFYSEDKELSSCVYKKAEAKGTSCQFILEVYIINIYNRPLRIRIEI